MPTFTEEQWEVILQAAGPRRNDVLRASQGEYVAQSNVAVEGADAEDDEDET